MRPKWRCQVIMHSITFGENQTQHISTNTSYQLSSTVVEGWWFGLVLQPQDWDTLQSLSWPWTPLYFSILESNVRPSVGYLSDNDLKQNLQIYNRMAEKNRRATVKRCGTALRELYKVFKQMPTYWHQLKQYCKEEWSKLPLQQHERLITSCRKWLLQLIAAKGGSTSCGIMGWTSHTASPSWFSFCWIYNGPE